MDIGYMIFNRGLNVGRLVNGRSRAHLLHFMTQQIGLGERRLYRPQNLEDTGVQVCDRGVLGPQGGVDFGRIRGIQM